MSELIGNTATRSLKYDFTPVELHEMAQQLATKTKEHLSVEEEKKSVNSQFKARMDEINATCNKLANQISDGFEYREVQVQTVYHKPAEGQKTLIRQDTMEEIVEPMEAFEFNLFNQAPESTTDDAENAPEKKDEFFGAAATDADDDLPEYAPDTFPKGVAKKRGRK